MKLFETRRKLREQRDISARQHDRVSRDLEAAHERIDHYAAMAQAAIRERDEMQEVRDDAWDIAGAWKDQHDKLLSHLEKVQKAHVQVTALATEYAAILADTYGWTPPEAETEPAADWTEQPADDERIDEHVEQFPSLYMKVQQELKEEHPERAGHTMTWHKPLTPEQEEELQKELPDVAAWDAFTTSVPVVDKPKPRRRVPAARNPSSKS